MSGWWVGERESQNMKACSLIVAAIAALGVSYRPDEVVTDQLGG